MQIGHDVSWTSAQQSFVNQVRNSRVIGGTLSRDESEKMKGKAEQVSGSKNLEQLLICFQVREFTIFANSHRMSLPAYAYEYVGMRYIGISD